MLFCVDDVNYLMILSERFLRISHVMHVFIPWLRMRKWEKPASYQSHYKRRVYRILPELFSFCSTPKHCCLSGPLSETKYVSKNSFMESWDKLRGWRAEPSIKAVGRPKSPASLIISPDFAMITDKKNCKFMKRLSKKFAPQHSPFFWAELNAKLSSDRFRFVDRFHV